MEKLRPGAVIVAGVAVAAGDGTRVGKDTLLTGSNFGQS